MTAPRTDEQARPWLPWRTSAVMLVPSLLLITMFLILPFVWTMVISLSNLQLLGDEAAAPQWVGLANYARLFNPDGWLSRGGFGWSLWVTFQFVIGSAIIGQAGLGLALAWALHGWRSPLRELVFSLAILAWILPDTVVAFAWFAVLNPGQGALNTALAWLGLGRPDWQLDYALLSVILFNTWRGAAFSMLLFSAALATIPPSYLEASTVAGASAWQRFRDIILPLLRAYIITDLLLVTLWTLNTFTPYLLTGGGPVERTELLSIYIYLTAFVPPFRFGQGAAISMVVLAFNLALGLCFLGYTRRNRVQV
ncbi:MAG: sugar ABC transporter permease [Anaerolineae bacterium]